MTTLTRPASSCSHALLASDSDSESSLSCSSISASSISFEGLPDTCAAVTFECSQLPGTGFMHFHFTQTLYGLLVFTALNTL